ncbi:MAG: hypothetical protein WDZ83_18380 [Rhizobiaceae bacterium]
MSHGVVLGAGLGGAIMAQEMRDAPGAQHSVSEPFYERLSLQPPGIDTLREINLENTD